ncbi:MAG: hypothetical protein KAT90_12025, partial [Gammaproteobacteria bacterium]|nr:hypothetical protein [Gammaproteobacteria bacterium]
MINNVWLNDKFVELLIKPFVLMALFTVATTVSAQTDDALVKQEIESVNKQEVKLLDAVSSDNKEQVEEYNIYRKEHPDNPCARDMDTYDYEKSWYDDSQIYINSRF